MRKRLVVGILKEIKQFERRAPLTPHDVGWLRKKYIKVEVESSPLRVFKDSEYSRFGAKIVDKIKNADLLLGIKEPDAGDLHPRKIYMVFSHTAKGQFHNAQLLRSCLEKGVTLLDYEKITDIHGKRLVYFGRFAGICGIIDSLYCYGKKLQWQGIKNPFSFIKPSYKYSSLKEAKKSFAKLDRYIVKHGFISQLAPFIIGITGHGNVSGGVQEILNLLNPVEIHPRDMLRFVKHQKKIHNRIYKIVFLREEKFRSKDKKGFYFEKYLAEPDKFESNMDVYLPYLNMLIHTSYWDKNYPKLITKQMVNKLSKKKMFRLEFIGDIACDISGSNELTIKATSQDNPVFTYNPTNKQFLEGYKTPGIAVLAVDNLPAELPKDASHEFSALIKDYVYQIAEHGVTDITNHAALPKEIRQAVITQNKRLTKNFKYLK